MEYGIGQLKSGTRSVGGQLTFLLAVELLEEAGLGHDILLGRGGHLGDGWQRRLAGGRRETLAGHLVQLSPDRGEVEGSTHDAVDHGWPYDLGRQGPEPLTGRGMGSVRGHGRRGVRAAQGVGPAALRELARLHEIVYQLALSHGIPAGVAQSQTKAGGRRLGHWRSLGHGWKGT